jgi:hypothetical protein
MREGTRYKFHMFRWRETKLGRPRHRREDTIKVLLTLFICLKIRINGWFFVNMRMKYLLTQKGEEFLDWKPIDISRTLFHRVNYNLTKATHNSTLTSNFRALHEIFLLNACNSSFRLPARHRNRRRCRIIAAICILICQLKHDLCILFWVGYLMMLSDEKILL